MFYREIESPVGPLLLAGDDEGLRFLLFKTRAATRRGRARVGARSVRASRRAPNSSAPTSPAGSATSIFRSRRRARRFSGGLAALSAAHSVRRNDQLRRARRPLGNPKAVRAVGLANGSNPIAIVIPCHRVIGSNGSLSATAAACRSSRRCWRSSADRPQPAQDGVVATGHNRLEMPRYTRRDFLTASAVGLGARARCGIDRVFARQGSDAVFRHGVASGDPLRDRVILWTRVTPANPATTVDVDWMMARDARMSRLIARGRQRTSAERDYTVKIDAVALDPGSTYYYRFARRAARCRRSAGRGRCRRGRRAHVRLALASCANLPFGFFNVYARDRRAGRSRCRRASRRLPLRVRRTTDYLGPGRGRRPAARVACRFPIASS